MIQELLIKFNFIAPIFYQILYMTVVGSIVGILVYFIRNIFDNKISGKWKCIMWCIVLVALLIPIRFEIKINKTPKIQNEIINRVEDIKYIGSSEYMTTESVEKISSVETHKNNSEIVKNNTEIVSKGKDINETNLATNTKVSIPLKTILINIIVPSIWILGVAIFILTFLSGSIKINKRISRNVYKDERLENILSECKNQLNIKKKVKIILQKYKKVPSIFGIFNPSILITENLLQEDDETIKYIFLHELAHYKRKDIIFNFVLLCVLSIHWFNPIVWFLFNKIRQDIEIGADELASKKLNKTEKKEYGMVLINLLRNRQQENYTANMLCMSDTGKNMERRILMIKGKRKSIILSFLIVTVVVGVLAGFVFVKVTEKENINNDNLGLNSNNDIQTEELTDEERNAVVEYVNKICNVDPDVKIPEFKDINEADKYWIYSHLIPGTPAYINDDPYIYEFGYSTKQEIEDCIKNLFGMDLIVDLDKDMNENEDLLKGANNIIYDKERNVYEFLPYGWYTNTYYAIDSIEKKNNQYIVKAVEYFDMGGDVLGWYANTDNDYYKYSYVFTADAFDEDMVPKENSQIFRMDISNYETRQDIKKALDVEVLKQKEKFESYYITLGYDKNGKICVKSIEKTENLTNEISNTTPVGNLDLEITYGSYFSDGLASVAINGEHVYIDKTGNIILKCDARNDFHDGLVLDAKDVGNSKYKYGYLDKQGNVAIDYIYDSAYSFVDGLAPVKKDGKQYYIDTKGNIVIDNGEGTDAPEYFFEGVKWIYNNEKGKVACIDKQGNIVIDYIYDNAMNFSEGLCCVIKDRKFGYIDKQGNVVIDLKYNTSEDGTGGYMFKDGLALIYDNGKYQYLDKQGNIALVSPYEKAGSFTEGLAWAYKDGKYGFIDKQGNVAIDFQYDSIDCFSEGLALVEKNGKFGYIDYDGKVIIGKLD